MQETTSARRWTLAAAAAMGLVFCEARAAEPAEIFTDHMVLQRGMPVPVWGTGSDGEKVTVSFAGQTRTATVKGGKWRVDLDALKASAKARTLVVQSSIVNRKSSIKDVLVGEVWLCSGQSNMAWTMRSDKSRAAEANTTLPNVRFVGNRGSWQALGPETMGRCSAAAYHFGKYLHGKLDVPVGLVVRATGGRSIQYFMPAEAAEACRKKYSLRYGRGGDGPAGGYRGLIEGIIPLAIKGVIWYQGERNAKTGMAWVYQYMLADFAKAWRKKWGRDEMPIIAVQIPVQDSSEIWPIMRDSMRRALATVPNYGMIVYYDKGYHLHPSDKTACGQRLAMWALGTVYGRKLVYSGPLLKGMTLQGAKAVLAFDHVGGGLQNPKGGKDLEHFEVCGADGKWVKAAAKVVGNKVEVTAGGVTPAHVRYAWMLRQPCLVGLQNAEGLPASTFSTRPSGKEY